MNDKYGACNKIMQIMSHNKIEDGSDCKTQVAPLIHSVGLEFIDVTGNESSL